MAKVNRAQIDKEFGRQGSGDGALPPEAERDALAQLATGLLRTSVSSGFQPDTIRKELIANVVWAYVYPQDPRDVHASMMPKLITSALKARGVTKPGKDVVKALQEVAIGWLQEGRWPWPSMGKLLGAQGVVSYYLDGV